MNYDTIGNDYNVFPYGMYSAKVALPRPYYSYEPRGPGTNLYPPTTNVDPYGTPGTFGWTNFKNGYGEGNLIGHVCSCECESTASGYGPETKPEDQCWCPTYNKTNYAVNKLCGTPNHPCPYEAVNVKNIRLR